jgi:hypothetical protein
MPRESKLWYIAAISLSLNVFGLSPATAVDCRFDSCGSGYVIEQIPVFYGRPSTYAGYARYCDGYGGGQDPYASCSVGRTEYIAPTSAPALPIAGASASPPIVTKHSAEYDGAPLSLQAVLAKAPAPAPAPPPIVTKYRADAH